MKKFWHKIEVAIDWVIPWCILLLLIIIILEIFFHDLAETYHLYIQIGDYFIVSVFIIDLVFKYMRIRNIKNFIKECWLDILAVFPFFIFFRMFERIIILAELSGGFTQFQLLFHEGLEIEKSGSKILKEGGKIIQEAEKVGKVSRVKQIVRFFKPIQRAPRLIKALPFYEKPTGKHHLHEAPGEKEYKWTKKEAKIIEKDIIKKEKKLVRKLKKETKKERRSLGI